MCNDSPAPKVKILDDQGHVIELDREVVRELFTAAMIACDRRKANAIPKRHKHLAVLVNRAYQVVRFFDLPDEQVVYRCGGCLEPIIGLPTYCDTCANEEG